MGKVLERFWGILAASERWFIGGHGNPGSRVVARVLPLAAGPAAGRRRALYDGGHWLVGVFPVLPAEPVVPGASASSGGGTGAVERPDAVRSRQDPQRQSYPGAPVSPDHFHPVFTEVVAELEGSGGLDAFRFPIKLPRSTGSIATQFQSHLELLVRKGEEPKLDRKV